MVGNHVRRCDPMRTGRGNRWLEVTGKYAVALTVGTAIGTSIYPLQAQELGLEEQVSPQREAWDDLRPTILDRIAVVSRTAQRPIDTMASASQVAGEDLELRMATTSQDVLFGVPGISVQEDTQRVAAGFNIRGLQDFGRVAVIVDGARQNFQRSSHGTQSMVFVDPELIEQVDVVRGPVANTYGSGAIGGVVYFETKDAEDFLHPEEVWAASLSQRYETNGSGWTTSATGAYRFSDAADVLANVVWRDYGAYEDGSGNPVSGTGFEVLGGLAKATLNPTERSELKLGWTGTSDNWSVAGGGEELDLRQNTYTARYNITDPSETWLDLNVNASLNRSILDETDPDTGTTNYDLGTYGLDIWNTSRFQTGLFHHKLTYGGDWLHDDVVTTSPDGGSDLFTPSGKRSVWGAYVEDHITYDWLEIVGGLRYDSYRLEDSELENSGHRLSPRLTVGVSPFEGDVLGGLQLYGTYAEGYRSPSVTETLVSGLHPFPPFPFLPNPDLQPETAKTWEAGINYKRDELFSADDSFRLKASYFHNDVDDYIDFRQVSTGPGCTAPWYCYQYRNYANAEIQGFELEAAYDAGRYFGRVSASVIEGHKTSYDGMRSRLVTQPETQVTGQLGFRLLERRLILGGEVQYNEAPNGAEFAEDYTLTNLFASYQANPRTRFDLRVNNLFDVKYVNPLNDTTTPVYEPGLNIKLAARFRFGG